MGSKPLWFMEGHSVACFNYFQEYLGILTTQFGFGTPDYQAQSEMDGAFRNDERQASAAPTCYRPSRDTSIAHCDVNPCSISFD